MKKFSIFILIMLSLFVFYNINNKNYEKHIEIKQNLVKHPEYLPTKETAKYTAFWFKNLRADLYRLQAIQYIWSNAISSEYKKYLYIILDLITELNPFFEHPYVIGSLLLPDYNQRYEDLSQDEQNKHVLEWEEIWLKWIENFCNLEKIELIKNENNLIKIWKEEKYLNPCKTFSIPYYLAYLYYFYKKEPLNAANYYKVASANEDSPEWAKIMAAIMQWKWWNREKSYFMLLNLAKFIENEDKVCIDFASELENIWAWIFIQKNILLDEKIIKLVQEARIETFWEYDEKNEEVALSNTKCSNYVNKAVRELNLAYIEKANEEFKKDHNWAPALNAKWLFDDWYIKFLPTDFQQYKDYWIIYEYNKDTKNYDYSMWNY